MPPIDPLLVQTRRHFFRDCAVGVGAIALGSLLNESRANSTSAVNPLAPKLRHFTPKARSIIFLLMAGGPSQFETWDCKPGHTNGGPINPTSATTAPAKPRMRRPNTTERFTTLGPGRNWHSA